MHMGCLSVLCIGEIKWNLNAVLKVLPPIYVHIRDGGTCICDQRNMFKSICWNCILMCCAISYSWFIGQARTVLSFCWDWCTCGIQNMWSLGQYIPSQSYRLCILCHLLWNKESTNCLFFNIMYHVHSMRLLPDELPQSQSHKLGSGIYYFGSHCFVVSWCLYASKIIGHCAYHLMLYVLICHTSTHRYICVIVYDIGSHVGGRWSNG